MSLTIAILIILLGIVLILVEVLFVPGVGIVGIIGFGVCAIGVYRVYQLYGPTYGHISLGATLVVSIILLIVSFRSNTWKRLELKDQIEGRSNNIPETAIGVGDKGLTLSVLRPMGTAYINDEKVEVQSQHGKFVEPQVEVEVVQLEGQKIIVKPIT